MKKTVPLKKNYEFHRVYKKGKFYVGKYIVLYVLPNNLDTNRLGIAVSRKIGKSVVRNRIKRLIREGYRKYEDFTANSYDFVIAVRPCDELPDFSSISRELKYLLKKLDVFDREKWNCLKDL